MIGDRYQEIDANGKVTCMVTILTYQFMYGLKLPEDVKDQGTISRLVPFGFEALLEPLHATTVTYQLHHFDRSTQSGTTTMVGNKL